MSTWLTYGKVLVIFLLVPICALLLVNRSQSANKQEYKRYCYWVLVIGMIAAIWTPLWDNYLVATRVWWYDPNLTWNLVIYYVPCEEYLFFVLQPILSGLYLYYCFNKFNLTSKNNNGNNKNNTNNENNNNDSYNFNIFSQSISCMTVFCLTLVVWLISVLYFIVYYYLYFSNNTSYVDALNLQEYLYLNLILVWSLPPLMMQFVFAIDNTMDSIKLLGFVIVSATLYLSVVDTIAIQYGIWTISPAKSIESLMIFNVLPFEEFFFFFITNVLCVNGCSLYLLPKSKQRVLTFCQTVQNQYSKRTAQRKVTPKND